MEAFIKIGAKIVLSLFVLGTILSVGACSSLEKGISLKAGCDLICQNCGHIELSCRQDNDSKRDTTSTGTVSGPSLGH